MTAAIAAMPDAASAQRLIFDVGMHQGEDTAFYLKKGFRVVGFEADPRLAAGCRTRFADAIASGMLTIVEGAICEPPAPGTDRPETIRFYRNTGNTVWGTVDGEWASRNESLGTRSEIIEVPVVDFAECLRRFGVPYYLKIDIEGMDRVCLKALATVEQRPAYVSIEAEKVDRGRLEAEVVLLTRLGYAGFQAIQQSGISTQREPEPPREGHYAGHRFAEGSSGLFGEDLPGPWTDAATLLRRYRRVFVLYRWFGDSAVLPRLRAGRLLIKVLSRLSGRPIPGWYDTHARHRSAAQRAAR
ncbi:MAG: FkbM family methyltransferase [Lautropia sp.]